MKSNVLHSPNLETVLMVEKSIKESDDYPTKTELWKSLPKQVQYQTFSYILEYLEASNKIIVRRPRSRYLGRYGQSKTQGTAGSQRRNQEKVKGSVVSEHAFVFFVS